jgi:hypothetical protein
MTARPAADVAARIDAIAAADPFGWQRESLVDALPLPEARPFLRADLTDEDLADWQGSPEHARQTAVDYLRFAAEKALGHRGLSASRSVEHYRGWLYALGLDGEIDWGDYPQYGVPILLRVATVLDVGFPGEGYTTDDEQALLRMAQGDPCRPGCREGCG